MLIQYWTVRSCKGTEVCWSERTVGDHRRSRSFRPHRASVGSRLLSHTG